jgi:hypothetical protein
VRLTDGRENYEKSPSAEQIFNQSIQDWLIENRGLFSPGKISFKV